MAIGVRLNLLGKRRGEISVVAVIVAVTSPLYSIVSDDGRWPEKTISIPPNVRHHVGVNIRENRTRPTRECRRSAHEPANRGNDSGAKTRCGL